MVVALSILVVAVPLLFVYWIDRKALRKPVVSSWMDPVRERRNATYESLRDLQFDFRTGKLSEADYQASKVSLQKELATIVAQMDALPSSVPASCAGCGEKFTQSMKFCGACGKAVVA
jgi:hypothetical protein